MRNARITAVEFVDNETKIGVALPATRLDSWTVSIELPKSLERAMISVGLVDPRSGNPSLNQWSKESGVHTSTISSFLTGRQSRQTNVQKMADALEVSPADLYSMVGRKLTPWSPPSGTEKLNTRQRQALNELILAFIDEDPAEKAGEGNADSPTPNKRAGVSPATGEDDGLGAFDGRARGDLDHEDLNDGNGDNVYSLVPPPPASDTAAYRAPNRGKKQKDKQNEDAEGSQDPEDDDRGPGGAK